MKFYSGFSLKNEEYLFDTFIRKSDYTVCGFSYGAIKAFEFTKEQLACKRRVDTLQLFSPAFFQNRSDKFKKLQLRSFGRSPQNYLNNFIDACFSPYEKIDVDRTEGSIEELEELLYYEWNLSELQILCDNGIDIEVYLGGKDNIIDTDSAKEFFKDVATVTYIKEANHFLRSY